MKFLLLAMALITSPNTLAKDMTTVSDDLLQAAATQKQAGKLAEAQFTLEKALVANPGNAIILMRLGEIHELQGRTGKALRYYRGALTVDPALKQAMELQAKAFLKKGLLVKAQLVQDRLSVHCKEGCAEMTAVTTAIADYKAKKEAELLAENQTEDEKTETNQ